MTVELAQETLDWFLPLKHELVYTDQFLKPGRTFLDVGAHVGVRRADVERDRGLVGDHVLLRARVHLADGEDDRVGRVDHPGDDRLQPDDRVRRDEDGVDRLVRARPVRAPPADPHAPRVAEIHDVSEADAH